MGSLGTCVLPLGFKARWGHHLFLGWDPPSKLAVELVWGGAAGQGCCREHPRGTFWCEDIPSAKGKDLGPCKERHSRAWGQVRRDVQELMGRQGEMFKGLGAEQGETFEGLGARQGELFKGFGARQGEMFKGLEPGKERHSRAWGQARRDPLCMVLPSLGSFRLKYRCCHHSPLESSVPLGIFGFSNGKEIAERQFYWGGK